MLFLCHIYISVSIVCLYSLISKHFEHVKVHQRWLRNKVKGKLNARLIYAPA